MSNTTPDAICLALETMIKALDPSGGESAGVGGFTTYQEINDVKYNGDPENVPKNILDRHFIIDGILPADVDIEGNSTSNTHVGVFELAIAHKIVDYKTSRDRRDKDLHQLVAQLIKESSRPNGVWRIWYQGFAQISIWENTLWWTTLTFGIDYIVSSNYGG